MQKGFIFFVLFLLTGFFARAEHVTEPYKVLEGPESDVEVVAFTPDQERLFVGGWDNDIFIYDWPSGELLEQFTAHQSAVLSLQFSKDGEYFMTGSNDNTARLWETESLEHIHTFRQHNRPVKDAAISPDNQYILTASEDGTIKIYDREQDFEMLRSIDLDGEDGNAVLFEPQRGFILTATSGSTARMLQPGSLDEMRTFHHEGGVNHLYFVEDGSRLATASDDRTAAIWDPAEGSRLQVMEGHGWRVLSIDMDEEGDYAVTASNDGTARLWDARTGDELRVFEPEPRSVIRSAVITNDLEFVVTSGQMRQPDHEPIMIWKTGLAEEETDEDNGEEEANGDTPSPETPEGMDQ